MRVAGIFSNYTKSLNFNAHDKGEYYNQPNRVYENKNRDTFIKTADRVSEQYYKNGNIASKLIYKNHKPYKEIWYDRNGKKQWERCIDGSFNLSRNPWYDWKKEPHIDLTKTQDGKTIRLHAKPAIMSKDGVKGEVGAFNLGITDEEGRSIRSALYVEPDGTYKDYNDENLPYLKEALIDLMNIISSDEYNDSFGNSRKFNSGVEDAIKYIEETEELRKEA